MPCSWPAGARCGWIETRSGNSASIQFRESPTEDDIRDVAATLRPGGEVPEVRGGVSGGGKDPSVGLGAEVHRVGAHVPPGPLQDLPPGHQHPGRVGGEGSLRPDGTAEGHRPPDDGEGGTGTQRGAGTSGRERAGDSQENTGAPEKDRTQCPDSEGPGQPRADEPPYVRGRDRAAEAH